MVDTVFVWSKSSVQLKFTDTRTNTKYLAIRTYKLGFKIKAKLLKILRKATFEEEEAQRTGWRQGFLKSKPWRTGGWKMGKRVRNDQFAPRTHRRRITTVPTVSAQLPLVWPRNTFDNALRLKKRRKKSHHFLKLYLGMLQRYQLPINQTYKIKNNVTKRSR